MKIIDVEQGSDAWVKARLGLPTSSGFDLVITKSGKPSTSAKRYLGRCLAEWWLQQPVDDYQSPYMQRGQELEATAVASWEFSNNVETTKVGLCLSDDGRVGASPDRLVGDDGLLEIKVPGIEGHMAYLLDDGKSLCADYWVQLQGQLYVTGRKWVEIVSWNAALPAVSMRCPPDAEFHNRLDEELGVFCDRLDEAKRKFAPLKLDRERALEKMASEADTGF